MNVEYSILVRGRLVTLANPSEARDLPVIDDGAVVFDHRGRIIWTGRHDDVPATDETIDHRGQLITPGLIDAHTHPVFGGNRSNEFEMRCQGATYQEIAAAGGGIQSTVRATRAASEAELFEDGKRHVEWFLANGTTTIEAKSGYGLNLEDELKILRVIWRLGQVTPLNIVPTLLAAHAYPPEYQNDHAGYVDLICNVILPRVAEEPLALFVDAFCEERYFDVPTTEQILRKAKDLGLGIRLHADQLTNGGGAKLAAKLGAKTADHLEQTDEEGMCAMRQAGVQPVLLPASVYSLGLKKYPNARKMIDLGMDVVLATDFNPGSSPTPSLPFVMSLACTQMGMTPTEALIACTINAARSLNLDDQVGSLEVGKQADFVVWDCEDPREIPYWIGAPLVHSVYTKGRLAYKKNLAVFS